MSEITRGEINDIIAKYASKDEKYKKALLADPKRILGMQMGQKLPDFLNVKVVEETADTIYLVLPHQAGEELSDADLEMVAGGKKDEGGGNSYECQVYGAGNMGTHNEIDTEMSVF
jgi:hypothetical protein